MILCVSQVARAEKLEIFVMRETITDAQQVTLGMISLIHGDAKLSAQVSQIALGKLVRPGQQLILDRETILSRLIASGVALSKVQVLGSRDALVRKSEVVISSQEIIDYSKTFIRNYTKEKDVAFARAISKPAKIIVAGKPQEIEIACQWEKQGLSRATVRVEILLNGTVVESRKISFKFQYEIEVVLATKNIASGELITAEDYQIKKILVDSPAANLILPKGKIATRRINAGREIKAGMFGDPKLAIVVKKKQMVEIKYESDVLFVSALGEALSDGKVGDLIKVVNVKIDDRGKTIKGKVILAKVLGDGSVRPAY